MNIEWSQRGNGDARPAPRVLLLGYSGANNTGAEALLLADIQDVRAVFGPQAVITIPSLNPPNLRRYVREAPNLHIAPLPTVYVSTLLNLVKESDLVMLVEGSTYMDSWSSAMLWAYLLATHWANNLGIPNLAYAVDAGQLKHAYNRWLVRREGSRTDLIIARSQAAAERLQGWGVTAPIEATADNAFTFLPDPADGGLFERLWPEAGERVIGLALVDFYLFPVGMCPWGPKEECYKWPYYFNRTPEACQASDDLTRAYAWLGDHLVSEHDVAVALICMEELDERIARRVHDRMQFKERARVFSSREYNASKMTSLLRGLDFLVTSRYHACVLSMAAQVPQIAVGHDLRLKSIYAECGMEDLFVDAHLPDRDARLQANIDRVLADPETYRAVLRRAYAEHLEKARCNRQLLQDFARANGWEAVPSPAAPIAVPA